MRPLASASARARRGRDANVVGPPSLRRLACLSWQRPRSRRSQPACSTRSSRSALERRVGSDGSPASAPRCVGRGGERDLQPGGAPPPASPAASLARARARSHRRRPRARRGRRARSMPARRRARWSSGDGTSRRRSPRSRGRSTTPCRSLRPTSSSGGSRISRIRRGCPCRRSCRARSRRARTRRHRAGAASSRANPLATRDRSVVTDEQQLGLERHHPLERFDEARRVAVAIAADRHEIGEVAEERAEQVSGRSRCAASGSHTTSESVVSPPGVAEQLEA